MVKDFVYSAINPTLDPRHQQAFVPIALHQALSQQEFLL